jgi:Zn-dependent protease
VSIDDDHTTNVISYPTFTELHAIISRRFEVQMSLLEYGMPTFVVKWAGGVVPGSREQDAVFKDIEEQTESLKVWPVVRWRSKEDGEYVMRFVPIQKQPEGDRRINYALFVATLGTIALAGFLQATNPIFLSLFYPNGYSIWDLFFVMGTFMLALMGIIFTHEMGHYKMSQRRKIEASLPYFIPGLPQIGGTFGAFISQKSPPKNREDLIDMGLAGPFAGFAVTLVVLVIGFLMSLPLTAAQLTAIDVAYPSQTGSLAVPLLFSLLEMGFPGMIPADGTLYLHPIGFAAWVGMLVTSLNLFPVAQLDGGHALRAIVPAKIHKQIGWVAIVILLLAGYILMAVLILALSAGGGHPGPLNDTVPVTKTRVVLFVLAMIVLVLCIPPLWQMGLF